jgi:SAM-dependent methyltransferase
MNSLARGLWRLIQPVRQTHGLKRASLPRKYAQFLSEWRKFNAAGGHAAFDQLNPTMNDRDPGTQSGAGHYFYQDVWALRRLAAFKPDEHHDVGSRFDGFVGQATAFCKIICWDIRPPNFKLPDFEFRAGSILEMPLPDRSVRSLSCLHVAEHIGLGRYGDPLDPDGTEKAIRELGRLLAPGGQLLFSMPIGKERVEFNAQRVWDPRKPPAMLPELKLVEFSAVGDDDTFAEATSPENYIDAKYSCGLYRFVREQQSGL